MTKKHTIAQQKKKLMVDFSFHNVGEGLFYTGKVDDFDFIYDCGSQNGKYLDYAVRNYIIHELRIPKVDLLIISHLHNDHVAGLNTLLSKVSVDTVILPYLSPIERLMVALKKTNLPFWFYDFLADPVTFLIEKGVNKVILIGGREAHSPEHVFSDEERFENEEKRLDLSEMPEDEQLRKEVIEKEKQLQGFFDQRRLLTKSHSGYLKTKGIWFFRFFNCKVEDSKINLFIRCVNSIMQNDDLISVLRSKLGLRQVRKCYESLQGNFNDTSLLVYHAPIMPDKLSTLALPCNYCPCIIPICSLHFPNKFSIYLNNVIGHFLTGDVNLNNKWTEIERHYDHYLSEASLILVPHHGAKDNWGRDILTKISRKCSWVVSAGISKLYGHPSFKVMQDIISNGNTLLWSNELNEISIKCKLLYRNK